MKYVTALPRERYSLISAHVPLSCIRAILATLLLATVASRLLATDITVLRDPNGQFVYVSSEDQELRDSIHRGGVRAGLRVIDERKTAITGIDQFIEEVSLEQRLDPMLVRAIIQVESAWNVRACSHKGALGLMQLMPETASRFGVHDPFDAKENVRGGTRYLRFLLDRFGGDLKISLAAYNAGEKAVDKWGSVPPYKETQAYIRRINLIYAARQQETVMNANVVSRTIQGNAVSYTNHD